MLAALNPGRRAVKALAAVAALVFVAAAFIAWRSQPRAEVVATPSPTVVPAPIQASQTPLPPPSPSVATIVVAVTGRVHHPGLVTLPSGARVADAIAAAGGALPNTDLSFVNLARKLSDGELIVIGVEPSPGEAADPTGGDAPPSGAAAGPVNINTAGLAQLQTLPGIGPALAQRILDYRTQHGPFRSADDLQNVSGIGPSKYDEIKALVTV